MLKKYFISAFLLFFTISAIYSQHSIFVGFGKTTPQQNMYFSKGASLGLGYKYEFEKQVFIRTSLNVMKLNQNTKYNYLDDNSIDSAHFFYIDGIQPEFFLTNLSLNTDIGAVFLKKYRINPVVAIGLSVNYTLHSYMQPVVNSEYIQSEKTIRNTTNIGFYTYGGLSLRITDNFSLTALAQLSWLPFCKTGYSQKDVTTFGIQYGFAYVL